MLNTMFLKGRLTSVVLKLLVLIGSLQKVIDYTGATYWVRAYFSIVCVFQTVLGKEKQLKVKQEPTEVQGLGKVYKSSDC